MAAQEGIGQGEAARLIADELGLDTSVPRKLERKKLPKCPVNPKDPNENLAAHYCYQDVDGRELYYVLRYEKPGYQKDIRQGRYINKRMTFGLGGMKTTIYKLPEVLASPLVVVVEGENKVEALQDLGICATCNTGGAVNGNWKDKYSEYLRDKAVFILPDNDKIGHEHAERVAASVAPVAASVKVVELPGLPDKGDILDWLEVPGNDVERLRALMNDAPHWKLDKGSASDKSVAISLEDFVQMELRPREYVVYPVLPEQGTAMVFAYRGVGKTHFALAFAYAAASGSPLFGGQGGPKWFAPKTRRVLFVDGEMAQTDMQERLRSIVAGSTHACPPGNFKLITPDQLPPDELMPNLTTARGQQWLDHNLHGVELLVLDNLATLCGRSQENTGESWLPIQKWLLSLRRRGISVLLVHHAGKNGEQRDSSTKEDILDTSIRLRRPDDYMPEDGARFVVELTKARGICGPDAAPFEAALTKVDDKVTWTTKTLEEDDLMAVVELIKAGKSIRATAAELGVTPAMVQRRQKKAKNLGLL